MFDNDASVYAKRLRERRQEAGLTQEDLAELTGINQSTISQLERAAQSPSVYSLIRLARALGVSVEWLLGEDDPKQSDHLPQSPSELEYLTLLRRAKPEVRTRLLTIIRLIIDMQE